MGTMVNGPDKAYARCSVCGSVDYDKYEGDRCARQVETSSQQRRASHVVTRASRAEVDVEDDVERAQIEAHERMCEREPPDYDRQEEYDRREEWLDERERDAGSPDEW
jgi:hypothetical protein